MCILEPVNPACHLAQAPCFNCLRSIPCAGVMQLVQFLICAGNNHSCIPCLATAVMMRNHVGADARGIGVSEFVQPFCKTRMEGICASICHREEKWAGPIFDHSLFAHASQSIPFFLPLMVVPHPLQTMSKMERQLDDQ